MWSLSKKPDISNLHILVTKLNNIPHAAEERNIENSD